MKVCKHYIETSGHCSYRVPNNEGEAHPPQIGLDIVEAFQKAAIESGKEIGGLGVGCGRGQCCFAMGYYAKWHDCPYYE